VHRAGPFAIAGVALIAMALRASRADLGFIGNEMSNLLPGDDWWSALSSSENGINPPLLRTLTNMAPHALRLEAARWGAVLSGGVLAGCAAAIGARRSLWLAAVGLVLAVQPMLVVYGALARSYAFWAATFAVHVLCLDRVLDDRASTGVRGLVVLTGLLLPWWHYLALPGILAEIGLVAWLREDLRPDLKRVSPALLAWAPLLYWTLTFAGRREATTATTTALDHVAKLGWDGSPAYLGTIVLVGTLVLTAPWRHLRGLVLFTHGMFAVAAISLSSFVHITRPPTAHFVLVPLVLSLTLLEARLGKLVAAAAGILTVWSALDLREPRMLHPAVFGVPTVEAAWSEIREEVGDSALTADPILLGNLSYRLQGRHLCRGDDGRRSCATPVGECGPLDGIEVCPGSTGLHLGWWPTKGCTELWSGPYAVLERCP
jgi:hypothetical protein